MSYHAEFLSSLQVSRFRHRKPPKLVSITGAHCLWNRCVIDTKKYALHMFYRAELGRSVSNRIFYLFTMRAKLRRSAWKIWHFASCLSRSLKVTGTDTDRYRNYMYMISYQCSIATRGLSCTVSKTGRDIGRKWRFFPTQPLFDAQQTRLFGIG